MFFLSYSYVPWEKIRGDDIIPLFPRKLTYRGKVGSKAHNVLVWILPEEDPGTRILCKEFIWVVVPGNLSWGIKKRKEATNKLNNSLPR